MMTKTTAMTHQRDERSRAATRDERCEEDGTASGTDTACGRRRKRSIHLRPRRKSICRGAAAKRLARMFFRLHPDAGGRGRRPLRTNLSPLPWGEGLGEGAFALLAEA